MSDATIWLTQLGLEQYAAIFAESDIDEDVLSDLTDEDLKGLGISLGHRKKLLRAIEALKQSAGVSATEAPETAFRPSVRAPSGIEAERRQLTVMFCDLVGSTELASRLDPEDLRDVMRDFQKACARVIGSLEGFIARYMGDGLLVYFGFPHAHEDDAERAVRAGLGIVDAVPRLRPEEGMPLGVRVGIATGRVVVGELIGEGTAQEHDAVGETPNLAARLQSFAPANSVIVGDETRKLLGASFQFEDLGAQKVKGLADSVRVWRIVDSSTAETRFEAAHAGKLTPFVGRDHEVALILERWQHTLDGDGQVILLVGEPGIGKSRILMTTRERLANSDFIVVRCQCSPYHRSSARHPFVEQLRFAAGFVDGDNPGTCLNKLEHLLDLPETDASETLELFASLLSVPTGDRYPKPALDPEVRRARTLQALIKGFELLARRHPLLMLVEDVHWADPTTLALLDTLVEHARVWRVSILITFRPEFEAPWIGLAHVSLLSLNRLDRRQCESMIARLVGRKTLPKEILDQIVAKTDGIPLFVEELTKAIIESGLLVEESDRYVLSGALQPLAIPTTLQDSLMARLDRLGEAKKMAQIGAAIGREFSHSLLLAVIGSEMQQTELALSRLVNTGLVFRRGTGSEARFVFKHALVQDSAYNSMLKSRRHELHGRIAATLQRSFPDVGRSQPELLAHHFAAAGLDEQALPHWRAAGLNAMERSACDEAITHFRSGLDALRNLETNRETAQRMVEIETSIAECLRVVDRIDEAFTSLKNALDIATRFGLSRHLSRVHHQRGNLYFPMAKSEACLGEHQRALNYAREAGSIEEEIRALGGLGDAHYVAGRMRTAKDYFNRCVVLACEHGFSRIAAANLSMRGFSRLYLLEIRKAQQDGIDAVTRAAEVGHPRAQLLGATMEYMSAYYMGHYEQALAGCERGEVFARRLGAKRFQPQNWYYQALSLDRLGRRAEAMALLEKAELQARQFSPRFTLARVLGAIVLLTDDFGRRERGLAEGERLLESGAASHNHFVFPLDAMDSCFDHEEWDRMDDFANRLQEYARAEPLPWSDFLVARARVLAAWGRGDRAPNVLAELRRLLAAGTEVGLISPADRIETALAGW